MSNADADRCEYHAYLQSKLWSNYAKSKMLSFFKYIYPNDSVLCPLSRMCFVSQFTLCVTGHDSRLLLPPLFRHAALSADMTACGILGIWWHGYTCSHMSEGIETYTTLCCLSWADVILGLLEIMALSVHSLLHFTLGIIPLLALRFTLPQPNISSSGSSAVSASNNSISV